MPKVFLTAAQREAEAAKKRQREFVKILTDRQLDGLSHRAIAADMGITPETISDWKRDVGAMSIRHLRNLIQAANLTDEEVLRIVRGKVS